MTISEIKKSAKAKLIGTYIKCSMATLLYFIVVMILTYIQRFLVSIIPNTIVNTLVEAIFAILSLLLGYGILVNIIELTDVKTNSITDFINTTLKNTTKYIKTLLTAIMKMIVPLIIFILSGFYLLGTIVAYINKIKFLCFSQTLLPLAIIIFVLTFIVLYTYSLCLLLT